MGGPHLRLCLVRGLENYHIPLLCFGHFVARFVRDSARCLLPEFLRVGLLQQILERSAFWKSLNVISTNYYTRSIWIRRASFSIEFFEFFELFLRVIPRILFHRVLRVLPHIFLHFACQLRVAVSQQMSTWPEEKRATSLAASMLKRSCRHT